MVQRAAVLITGFNRPVLLAELLELLKISGRKIYVSLDTPRHDDQKNLVKSSECIAVLKKYQELITSSRIADSHEGCFPGVSNGIEWAFEQEESLIILEDDILFSENFLEVMDQLLFYFKDEEKVGSIAGTNLVPSRYLSHPNSALRLSNYTSSWGWATWKRSWVHFNEDNKKFPEEMSKANILKKNYPNKIYWKGIFSKVASGEIDSWAYRWLYSNAIRDKKTITPNANLVLNRGFGNDATHTNDNKLPWWLPREIEGMNLQDVISGLEFDEIADGWMEKNHFRTGILQNTRKKIYDVFPSILIAKKTLQNRNLGRE